MSAIPAQGTRSATDAQRLGIEVGCRRQIATGTAKISQLRQCFLQARLRSVLTQKLDRRLEVVSGRHTVPPLLGDPRGRLSNAGERVVVIGLLSQLHCAGS